MSRFLEVGAWAFAGVLSLSLYNHMSSTQERLTATRNAQLDSIEALNTAGAIAALKLGMTGYDHPEPKKPRLKPVVQSKPDEMKQKASRCFKSRECYKLAEAIYFEDRGDLQGMKAVANVVINRTNSGKFPDTIRGVVNQKVKTKKGWVCQFSYMCQLKDRSMYDVDSRIKAGYVAWNAANGTLKDITRGADHYLNKSKVKYMPRWAYTFNKTVKIGDHTFYASTDS